MAAISDPKRKSGISLLGDAPWGTHFCQFYRTKQDLIDILVPYFQAGLENNEFCMWVTSEPLPAEEAMAELKKAVKNLARYDKKGQIEILDFSQWYTRTGKFDAGKVLQGWVDKEQQARKNGFEGLRLSGNTFWLEHKDWKSFSDYEATVNDVIHKYNMFALCTYSLDHCDANQILDVFSTHQFALINRNGKWTTIKSTERKGAEAAVKTSEERFRIAAESLTDVVYEWDLKEKLDWFGDIDGIMGYPAGGFHRTIDGWAAAIHPEDRARVKAAIEGQLKGAVPYAVEYRVRKKDGEWRWWSARGTALRDERGEPYKWIGAISDVTERKRVEEALRESEGKWHSLVTNAPDIIMNVDRGGQILFINRTVSGFRVEDTIGKSVYDFTSPENHDEIKRSIEKVFNTGEIAEYETEGSGAEGKPVWYSTRVGPIKKAGEVVSVLFDSTDITVRKRLEDALRLNEERLRLSVNATEDGIWEWNIQTNQEYFSPRWCEIIGYSFDDPELIHTYDTWASRIHPDDYDHVANSLKSHLEKRTKYDVDYRHRHKSGEYRWQNSKGKAICDESGKPIKMVGCISDITEHKRAEEALQESEQRFKAIFDHSNDGILLADMEKKRFLTGNETICQMLGYSADEIKDLGVMDIHPAEDLPYVIDQFGKQARKEVAIAKDLPVARKDGSVFYADVSAFPITLAGKPYLVGAFRDTTERKRVEETLRQSEERFRVLFEQAADIILLMEISPEGLPVIRDANSATVRLLGYDRDELIGQPVSIIEAAPDATKVVEERREAVLSESGKKIFEAKHRCKDGTVRDFECSVTEMQIGSKTFAISVERDITERRSLEAQLIQAQKMEAVGLLAGGIAHEFNNILGGILGYASLMRLKMEPDHPFWGYVETIEKSSQRAAALTSQLLGFARKGKYDLRLLNLNLLAEDTLAIVRQTFDRAVTVEARLAESLPKVEGDTMQLQQVLMNLCINARDAMPQGGSLVLTTGTEQVAEGDERIPPESKPGLYVLLSVADTGCGMDEETQAKIFEPFFTTKEKGKGTGLGLAMVYGVVKNHGGFVTVRSEVGRGSVFTLHLPAAEKPFDRRPEALAAPEKSRGAVSDQTILVVDDEENIRFLARDILEGEGYRVLLAEDGARALEIYREHQGEIRLVVLDLIMPKLGGEEVFLKMKEMDPGVHVLVSSGYSQEGKAQEILSGGALGFVQKPFHVRDLISQVRQGLDGKGG